MSSRAWWALSVVAIIGFALFTGGCASRGAYGYPSRSHFGKMPTTNKVGVVFRRQNQQNQRRLPMAPIPIQEKIEYAFLDALRKKGYDPIHIETFSGDVAWLTDGLFRTHLTDAAKSSSDERKRRLALAKERDCSSLIILKHIPIIVDDPIYVGQGRIFGSPRYTLDEYGLGWLDLDGNFLQWIEWHRSEGYWRGNESKNQVNYNRERHMLFSSLRIVGGFDQHKDAAPGATISTITLPESVWANEVATTILADIPNWQGQRPPGAR